MALVELLGEKLQGAGGAEVETSSLCGSGRYVGLYFSAHWCPPCRMFTPKLAEFYKAFTKKNEGKLEIVFVSADGKLEEFNDYFKDMPWLSLPYADRDREVSSEVQNMVMSPPPPRPTTNYFWWACPRISARIWIGGGGGA